MAEVITVVNKSGKVVTTGKVLVNVFKEAQAAYRERKAEIKAARGTSELYSSPSPSESQTTPRSSPRSRSPASSKPRKQIGTTASTRPPPIARGVSDSAVTNEPRHTPSRSQTGSGLKFEDELARTERKELVRRRSAGDIVPLQEERLSIDLDEEVDMDLAYGELPGPLPARRGEEEEQLRAKVSSLNRFLEEANCMQHSAKAIIKNLEENPDAMAAVGLTLAEISNLASKMAPGTLTALKGSFPAVIALLASPEFMIAAGVGVGITIIAFGGYKIIKKIKAKREGSDVAEAKGVEEPADELEDVSSKIGRIEQWRRGITDVDSQSVATSVEGEFITPGASKHLIEAGVLPPKDNGKNEKEKKERRRKKHGESSSSSTKEAKGEKRNKSSSSKADKHEKKHSSSDEAASSSSDKRSSRRHHSSSSNDERESERSKGSSRKDRPRTREPSGLRMLFKTKPIAV